MFHTINYFLNYLQNTSVTCESDINLHTVLYLLQKQGIRIFFETVFRNKKRDNKKISPTIYVQVVSLNRALQFSEICLINCSTSLLHEASSYSLLKSNWSHQSLFEFIPSIFLLSNHIALLTLNVIFRFP